MRKRVHSESLSSLEKEGKDEREMLMIVQVMVARSTTVVPSVAFLIAVNSHRLYTAKGHTDLT